jgi:hypothetical protein
MDGINIVMVERTSIHNSSIYLSINTNLLLIYQSNIIFQILYFTTYISIINLIYSILN